MSSSIRLVEYQESFLERSSLTDAEAMSIHARYANQVELDWPTPLTGHRWRLRSKGWVGYIPLGGGKGILMEPKVPIGNLIAMLGYAFDLNAFAFHAGAFKADSILDFFDRLARELAGRILSRAQRGLCKEYRVHREDLPYVRGRIDFPGFFKKPPMAAVGCEYEELTEDIEDNRILAWTLHSILLSGMCSQDTLALVQRADKVLRGTVGLERFIGLQCLGRSYNRLNAEYEAMHLLCRFFLECLSPTQNEGERNTLPFLVEMAGLFEVFVAKWLASHLDGKYFVRAQASKSIGADGNLSLTPDIVIHARTTKKALRILDTKYKAHGFVSSADWSQVVSYAEALDCLHSCLVYPVELSRPFDEKPGRIRAKSMTFDLDGDVESAGRSFLASLLPLLDG